MSSGISSGLEYKYQSDEPYTVEAELLYQTVAYAFGQDLFKDASSEVSDFKIMYEASDFKFVPMTNLQFNVQ